MTDLSVNRSFAQHRARVAAVAGRGMVMFNDRVVSGRDIVTSEQLSLLPKISEFQFLVAHHTWIRRATGLVFAGKITDHEFFELIRLIDHVMWNSEGTGNSACVCHGLWPATFSSAREIQSCGHTFIVTPMTS